MSALTPDQLRALRAVARAWPGIPTVVIGVSALAQQLPSYGRQTNDLDLVVATGVDDIGRLGGLPGWKPLPRAGEQAWQSPEGVRVDIVPASQRLLAEGVVRWPRSGMEMTLVGLRLAFESNQPLELGDGSTVQLASVPAVAVLKVMAFLDRPESREKDLEDLGFLPEHYIDDQDRRFDLIDAVPALDDENTGAFALRLDTGRLVNAEERTAVNRFVTAAREENSRTRARLLRLGPALWRVDDDCLPARLLAFDKGFRAFDLIAL